MIENFIEASIKQARAQQMRLFLLCSGEQQWHQTVLNTLLPHFIAQKTLFISNNSPQQNSPRVNNLVGAKSYLGQELQCVIYDYQIGVDPDILGIVSGCIVAGGILIMLTPPSDQWPAYPDPQYCRIISANSPQPDTSLYIKRFIRCSDDSNYCINLTANNLATTLPQYTTTNSEEIFANQQKAIKAIIKTATKKPWHPTLLVADRGRGKSAALGLAAQHLSKESNIKIVITGTSKQSVAIVIKHATDNLAQQNSQNVSYIPYDQLLEGNEKIDLLLIDEASAIPLSITAQLLPLYPRIALACTMHGYEGTGKGYLIKLHNLLEQHTKGYQKCVLHTPIRWREGDPLEQFSYQSLLLNAEISPINETNRDAIEIKQIMQSTIADDEQLLNQFYALLAHAHYRTRPFDLRHLLDNPSLSLFAAVHHQQLVAVAIVSLEGNFSEKQSDQIYRNQRRPNGHLLPQILCAQMGCTDAAQSRIARIIRIAVHPDCRRQGIATQLLTHIEKTFANKTDASGAAFALDNVGLRFWIKNNYQPLWIGHKKSKYTATHNIVLLKSFSDNANKFVATISDKFYQNFSLQLSRYYNDIDPVLIQYIYQALGKIIQRQPLNQQQLLDAHRFAHMGHHLFNNIDSLTKIIESILLGHHTNCLTESEKNFLVQRILQNQPWSNCTYPDSQTGKKQSQRYLAEVIKKALAENPLKL